MDHTESDRKGRAVCQICLQGIYNLYIYPDPSLTPNPNLNPNFTLNPNLTPKPNAYNSNPLP